MGCHDMAAPVRSSRDRVHPPRDRLGIRTAAGGDAAALPPAFMTPPAIAPPRAASTKAPSAQTPLLRGADTAHGLEVTWTPPRIAIDDKARREARRMVVKAALRERLIHDLGLLRGPAAALLLAAASLLTKAKGLSVRARGFKLLMRLHSSAWSPRVDRRIARRIRAAQEQERGGVQSGLGFLYQQTVDEAVRAHLSKDTPTKVPGARLLVVKSASGQERGAIVIDYSYVFPLTAGLYDLNKLAERYRLVLEPSWAGACTPDILLFTRVGHPVYVQTIEPRDRDFIESLGTNLQVVPIAANWWADPRQEPPSAERDIDVAMVAAWSDIKRHWRFFRALQELKRRGHRLRAALVGYAYDRSREDIETLAAYYGVADQIATYERISPAQVSQILARSKIHVLWSRRECANRAIIEAMLADTPVIVRDGLTFGFKYPYINEHTGRFVAEHELADAMVEMIRNRHRYSPRGWVLNHMTSSHATATLEEHLRRDARAAGEPWTVGLTMKTSALDTQAYLDPGDAKRFQADYEFVASCRRH
jgi:glycosyltransferase involved in cell wall biosynthesis